MPVFLIAAAAAASAPELSAAAIAAIAAITTGGTAATAGAIYYRQEIYDGISDLFTRKKDPMESMLDRMTIELESRQQQPVVNADSMHENLLERHQSLLSQISEQQEALDLPLMELGAATDQTTELTTTLTRLVPSLHMLADEATLDVQTMHQTTTDLCEQTVLSNHELYNTQRRLMEEEKKFATVFDGLKTTENTFARSRDIEQKMHRLSDLQQQTGNAPSRDELLTENIRLKQQIRDLQATAADTRELLIELSEENDTLKKSIHPPEPQRSTPSMTLFARV